MNARLAIVAVALAGTLAACSGSSSDAGTTTTSAKTATTADGSSSTGSSSSKGGGSSGGSCSGSSAGAGGVLQTFCDGSAKATVVVDGASHDVGGGDCVTSGGFFTLNAGVITGTDFSGTKPDYLGALLPQKDGAFTAGPGDATVSFAFDGTSTTLTGISGTHDAKGGSFAGTTLDGKKATGSFTC